ncbi:MAG: hypothetical protein RBS56_00800 [Candidatus Gracilibacteria bacterium]|jgi:hypothetical protein|nr:hypothetical protein [Candidatus Gracilibacteria bacterium]
MGTGKAFSHKEIDFTRSKGKDQAFEELLEKVSSAGGEIISDETSPMYSDMGNSEIETGTIREVLFNLAKNDFRLIREVQTIRISKSGKLYSTEELDTPMVRIKLFKKPELSQDWLAIDMEALL